MNGGKPKIAHIVNPVFVDESRELYWQQPITYSTMLSARRFAKKELGLDVELFATTYPEDDEAVPQGFTRTKNLDRSIQDIRAFPMRRKLPLFKDILDRLYESTEADYFIQPNIDIGLMPHFYASVARFINLGYDAVIINKRIISPYYRTVDQIPDMWSEIGTDHNGYDCFVFGKLSRWPESKRTLQMRLASEITRSPRRRRIRQVRCPGFFAKIETRPGTFPGDFKIPYSLLWDKGDTLWMFADKGSPGHGTRSDEESLWKTR